MKTRAKLSDINLYGKISILVSSMAYMMCFVFMQGCSGNTEIEKTHSQDSSILPTDTAVSVPIPKPMGRKLSIAFYNVENLFDTENDPMKDDAEFLPTSAKRYTTSVYQLKLKHISNAIGTVENAIPDDTLAFIGLAEVENQSVVEDLIASYDSKWKYIHRETDDPRGIDQALLYNPVFFQPTETKQIAPFHQARAVLWIKGLLLQHPCHIFVNHWTSRIQGGEEKRNQYAVMLKRVVDSLFISSPKEAIFIMGDFNDNPTDRSIASTLGATTSFTAGQQKMYNPFYAIYRDGRGSAFYSGAWDLFDQIIIGGLDLSYSEFFLLRSNVCNAPLLQDEGSAFPTQPKRFYNGNTLVGGYSDHFPVYLQVQAK